MEEENKKIILWWQHALNFLFNVAAGYVIIILVASYIGFIYLLIEGALFISYMNHNRKQDMLMQVLVIVTGLLIGYSLCVSDRHGIH